MKKIVFFDMDGTIYLENKLLPYAKEVFKLLNSNNIEYIFLTNNSSTGKDNYLNKIQQFGIQAKLDNFYSSIDYTIEYLIKNNIRKIYLLATNDFERELVENGIQIIKEYIKDSIDAVVVGFDKTLDYKKIQNASLYIQDDVRVIASHPDKCCPVENNKYIPDCGAIIDLLNSTFPIKNLKVLGKPDPNMILNILNKKNISKESALIIGDRMHTDILCGINANIDSVLVLTGETKVKDIENYNFKPKHIFKDLKEFYEYLSTIN